MFCKVWYNHFLNKMTLGILLCLIQGGHNGHIDILTPRVEYYHIEHCK